MSDIKTMVCGILAGALAGTITGILILLIQKAM